MVRQNGVFLGRWRLFFNFQAYHLQARRQKALVCFKVQKSISAILLSAKLERLAPTEAALPSLPFSVVFPFSLLLLQIFGCLFYAYFILVRLCVPVFRPESNQTFSTKSMVLAVFHYILPGNFYPSLCWQRELSDV